MSKHYTQSTLVFSIALIPASHHMPRTLPTIVAIALYLIVPVSVRGADRVAGAKSDRIDVSPTDWPWWRGPHRDGVADPDQKPPLHWSETESLAWKAAIPGRGHGSPIVVGDQVILATCDEDREIQSVLCFNRKTGSEIWKAVVHSGNIEKKENKKSSQASATVACDGQRLFITFQNSKAIYL